MTRLLCLVCLLVCTALPARAQAPMQIQGATTVDAQQILALVEAKPDLAIIDNRRPEDFNAGHLDGAVRLLDTDLTAEALAGIVKAKSAPVLFYCNGPKCGRAAKAAKAAVDLGYTQVYYYSLGMDEWNKLNLPLSK
ncbi:Rhodanese domain protein [Methylobacterium sp. 4-46]|uniref:rhodanese-like domain-containing protein n=1 Tax=unclassified Methylobacterium TaxID=2615210 RepID=UPI000152D4FD|nr:MULTISPECIES: rhodanese-like domain-containing protein [Methylobacterium]ACA14844.1 Rhodanese domain protein [Methylobacterium sp. 4-46]WFT80587.1 rhodanese-like domain-containing protein [Methylobacterium nodulans]